MKRTSLAVLLLCAAGLTHAQVATNGELSAAIGSTPMHRLALALVGLAAGPALSAASSARPVTYLPASQVEAAFAKGQPLVEQENYKIHASRREAPGQVEVHTHDTDIIHVLRGSATLVTGGTVMGGKETAPEELRGSSIEGGETRTLEPGDVVIVPNGVPHWFKVVPSPLTYYVVKVRAAGGGR